MGIGNVVIAAAAAIAVFIFCLLFEQFHSTGLIGLDWMSLGKLPGEVAVLLGAGAAFIVGITMNRATRA